MVFFNANGQSFEAEVRLALPQDAAGIKELVLVCYGLVCSDKTMYDEEKLAAKLACGDMIIELAQKADGQILGIESCCMKEAFPKTCYLKSKMTHPDYCQCGIGREITKQFMREIDFSGVDSAFAYALTYNDVSQSFLHHYHFAVTGLLYNSFLKSEETSLLPKRSHAVMVKNLGVADAGTLYLPMQYHDMARQVYASLNASVALDGEGGAMEGASVCRTYDMAEHQNTEIIIERAGEDLIETLAQLVQRRDDRPLQTYNLFLDLKQRSAVRTWQQLEAHGFLCSGFQPLSNGREFAVFYASPYVEAVPESCSILPAYQRVKDFFAGVAKTKREVDLWK